MLLSEKKKCKFALSKKKQKMTYLVLLAILIVLIALMIFVVKFFNKNEKSSLKTVVIAVFWFTTLLFAYLIYNSIQAPIKFDKLKESRFQVAVNKLIDLKNVQTAHKAVKGRYTDNFDELIQFVENDYFTLLERKDSSVNDIKMNKAFGLANNGTNYMKDTLIIKVIGKVLVKDSLFKDSDRYKRLNVLRVDQQEAPVSMQAGFIEKNDTKIPVFKASINKADLLKDQDSDLVAKEAKVVSVDGINGPEIILGSMEEVNLNGNWPKKYGKNE
jgi:hypothetical protein